MVTKVAIIGRPNVGKSALFNRMVRQRRAIVDSTAGVTRDKLIGNAELFNRNITLIDTGGIDPEADHDFNDHVIKQSLSAIEEADIIVFVVDGQSGPTILDNEIAKRLHQTKNP